MGAVLGKLPKQSSGAVLEEPPNLPARCFRHTRQARCRHMSDLPPEHSPTWPTSTHPSRWFSRATNKLHADPPWRQEWITTRPSNGPSIWAVLLRRTVVRSGLQHHRKVSRLRMVVELPAMATPPHGASARVLLLSKPSRYHRAIRVPAHHRPRTDAISTESRLHTVSPLHVLAITHHTKEQASTASQMVPTLSWCIF